MFFFTCEKNDTSRNSGLKVSARKIAIIHGILGRDYGIEEPYWGSSHFFATLTCKARHRQNYRKWPKLPRLGPLTPSLSRVTKEKIQQNIQLSWEGI